MDVPESEINDQSSPENIESWDSLSLYMLIDDIETVTGKVISKSESTKIIELKTTIKNSSHVLVDGKAKVILSK